MTVYRMRPRPIETDFMIFMDRNRDEIIEWMTANGALDVEIIEIVKHDAGPDFFEPGQYDIKYQYIQHGMRLNSHTIEVQYGDFIWQEKDVHEDATGRWISRNRNALPSSEWMFYTPGDALTHEERSEGWQDFGTYMAGVPQWVDIETTERYDEGGLPVGERINWEQTRANIISRAVLGAMNHLAEKDRHA